MFPSMHGVVSQARGVAGEPAEPVIAYGLTSFGGGTTGIVAHQRGYAFEKVGTHSCVGARVNLPSGNNETVRLWRESDEALLASVEITAVTNEWVEGYFTTPVTLVDGVTYLVTTRRTDNATRTTRANVTPVVNMGVVSVIGPVSNNTTDYPGFGTSELVSGVADVILEVPA